MRRTRFPGLRAMRAAGVLAASAVLGVAPAAAADWEWTVAPYFWGPSVDLEVEVRDQTLSAEAPLSDLLDKLEFAMMLHAEGRSGRLGFLADAFWIGLGETSTIEPQPAFGSGGTANTDLDLGIYEAAGFYRAADEKIVTDVLFGLRLVDMDLTLKLDATTPPISRTEQVEEEFLDGFVGTRVAVPFAERWTLEARADIGTGDTELTWNAAAGFGVRLGQGNRYALKFGYRHMEIETEANADNGTLVESEIALSGVIAGLAIVF